MKLLTAIIAFFLLAHPVSGQDLPFNKQTRIYIVRHAEKETGKDPVLTTTGNQRAGMLLQRLKKENVQHIYVTEYRRTQMTGDSLRLQLGIDTVHYLADTLAVDLLRKIMEHGDTHKTILVIGHSNTIPFIIRKLGIDDYSKANIPDNEFDNLFLITYKHSKARLKKMKYGMASGVSATMQ